MQNGKKLKDRATDSTEYWAVFGMNQNSCKSEVDLSRHLFFKSVTGQASEHEQESEFLRSAASMKTENPSKFKRRMAFIYHASRSSRELLFYNLNPQTQTLMEKKFEEIDKKHKIANVASRTSLLRRCLGQNTALPHDSSPSSDSTPTMKARQARGRRA